MNEEKAITMQEVLEAYRVAQAFCEQYRSCGECPFGRNCPSKDNPCDWDVPPEATP